MKLGFADLDLKLDFDRILVIIWVILRFRLNFNKLC